MNFCWFQPSNDPYTIQIRSSGPKPAYSESGTKVGLTFVCFLSFFLSYNTLLVLSFLKIIFIFKSNLQSAFNPGSTGKDPVKVWNLQMPNRHSSLSDLSQQDLSDGIGQMILDDPTKFRKYSNSKGMNVIVSDTLEPYPGTPVVHHVVSHATSL